MMYKSQFQSYYILVMLTTSILYVFKIIPFWLFVVFLVEYLFINWIVPSQEKIIELEKREEKR